MLKIFQLSYYIQQYPFIQRIVMEPSPRELFFSVVESEEKSIPLLVTNYHVLRDAVAGFVELHIADRWNAI